MIASNKLLPVITIDKWHQFNMFALSLKLFATCPYSLQISGRRKHRHSWASTAAYACSIHSVDTISAPAFIAVDGPAACGKGTLAKSLALKFNLKHLDTGLLYRAIGYKALQLSIPFDNKEWLVQLSSRLSSLDLSEPGLRSDDVATAASKISIIPGVREALNAYSRQFSSTMHPNSQGTILDGRDVGTVLCPDAHVKLFLTASAEVRARRRLQELVLKGMLKEGDVDARDAMYERVLEDLKERDQRDTSRSTAPLRAAEDAHTLDTTHMSAVEVVTEAERIVMKACPWLKKEQ
ncbi:hypothetical protein CEUSTIGMA_g12500.t1 [Chlamydomonas eustigma]|uniref:(d)CMP kinase n=1 Tax=Chlamydomonas eustigma TaxID=1157962 RepID=A0A250XQK5_9CHLO|nr:hypothetical protein CEUSTIGMA_g12500.t1 [Chlamydomonas eustigma]|eukprot:GAX85080.1 hypothetical protein CEUSTIGMA_g12500.t1 [Chlamydomonas eustigma]